MRTSRRLKGFDLLIAHPLRLAIVAELAPGPASAADLIRAIERRPTYNAPGLELGVVSYHCRTLAHAGVIGRAGESVRRGGRARLYALERPGSILEALERHRDDVDRAIAALAP